MKKSKKGVFFIMALSLGLMGCDQQEGTPVPEYLEAFTLKVASDGTTDVTPTGDQSWTDRVFTETEQEHLAWLGEQEKLEKEVFENFASLYDLPLWGNMAKSEATHLGCVVEAIEAAGLSLPSEEAGDFSQKAISDFYSSLTSQGADGQNEALLATLNMEEGVLADLLQRAVTCEDAALIEMVGSLQAGVRNHLRALYRVATRFELTYEPEFIDKTIFEQIVLSDFERQAACACNPGIGKQYRHRYGADGTSGGNGAQDGTCGTPSGGGKQYRGGRN